MRMRSALSLLAECRPYLIRAATVRERLRASLLYAKNSVDPKASKRRGFLF
jgi:hypothetical protein